MSSEDFVRSVALDRALQFHKTESANPLDTDVVATAEKFRSFLAGEPPLKVVTVPDSRPLFKLPSIYDNYIYFRVDGSNILYRSDVSYGPSAPGGVQRLDCDHEIEWRDLRSTRVDTRQKLHATGNYTCVTFVEAAQVIKDNVKGVRFE